MPSTEATLGLSLDTLQLDKLSGDDFEKVIGELLKYQGFHDLEFTPKSCDFVADILAKRTAQSSLYKSSAP